MTDAAVVQPWYRKLTRTQWNTLLAPNLGWVFDGFAAYALILTVGVARVSCSTPRCTRRQAMPQRSSQPLVGWGMAA